MKSTPTHKLHRSDSPATSAAAAKKVSTASMKARVLVIVVDAGEDGITANELLSHFPDSSYSTVTARPKALLEDGFIYYKGDTRNGSRVIRATPHGFNEVRQKQKSFEHEISPPNALPRMPSKW